MHQEDLDWLIEVSASGDYNDPRLVGFCEAQLREDLQYVQADRRLRHQRYSRRLADLICGRIEDRRHEIRMITCQLIQEKLDAQGGSLGGTLKACVRECAMNAFLRVYVAQQNEVLEAIGRSDDGSDTTTI